MPVPSKMPNFHDNSSFVENVKMKIIWKSEISVYETFSQKLG